MLQGVKENCVSFITRRKGKIVSSQLKQFYLFLTKPFSGCHKFTKSRGSQAIILRLNIQFFPLNHVNRLQHENCSCLTFTVYVSFPLVSLMNHCTKQCFFTDAFSPQGEHIQENNSKSGFSHGSSMFPKSSFVSIAFILVTSGSANSKLQNASSNSALSGKAPQSMDQTFNINNWGLGKVDCQLLIEMKYKIDSLYEKYGKGKFISRFA